jgi:hypothetical protein
MAQSTLLKFLFTMPMDLIDGKQSPARTTLEELSYGSSNLGQILQRER